MQTDNSRQEISDGLCAAQAWLPPKYLYDNLGSRLFDLITRLPEYYPTRAEAALIGRHANDIAAEAGTGAALIDLGAGNCHKARSLFPALRPRRYVAVDISGEYLDQAVGALHGDFPGIAMSALIADFLQPFELPAALDGAQRTFFFPGSSIGNLHPDEAQAFMAEIGRQCRGRGGLLIGIDLVKDARTLRAAYNDGLGLTAAFNLNVLNHINTLLGSNFRLSDWRHRADYDHRRSRIEMHLDAARDVVVVWPGGERRFRAGESIHTENSYKYRLEDFEAMMAAAGFRRIRAWTDERRWFALCHGCA